MSGKWYFTDPAKLPHSRRLWIPVFVRDGAPKCPQLSQDFLDSLTEDDVEWGEEMDTEPQFPCGDWQ